MIDKQSYRDAMASLGAAVNIITSDGPAGRCGCTASAVCGVTDEPPTLLVCINRNSKNNAAFKLNAKLCVNVLGGTHEDIAMHFASKDLDIDTRFAAGRWSALATGAPALDGAAVSLDCEISSTSEVGTHTVFYCTVKAVRMREDSDALIYFGRGFHHVPRAALAAIR
jgi:flavin reductase